MQYWLSGAAEILAAVGLAWFLRTFVAAVTIVRGNSMQPTLRNAEVLLVVMRRLSRAPLRRGDVVICRYPGRGRKYFIKRLVGMPGDTVSRVSGVTMLNGESLDARANLWRGDYEYVLGADEYFCVGDNRGNSHDSRDWQRNGPNQVGPISGKMICGTAKYVIWPPRRRRRMDRNFEFAGVLPAVPEASDTEAILPEEGMANDIQAETAD